MRGVVLRAVLAWALATAGIVAVSSQAFDLVRRDVTVRRPAPMSPVEVGEELEARRHGEPATSEVPAGGAAEHGRTARSTVTAGKPVDEPAAPPTASDDGITPTTTSPSPTTSEPPPTSPTSGTGGGPQGGTTPATVRGDTGNPVDPGSHDGQEGRAEEADAGPKR